MNITFQNTQISISFNQILSKAHILLLFLIFLFIV